MGQYIGARYVPRFMGTYDATQVYEGLDVVDNGMGTSYIAKQPVPAGTPLTNTTYWAIYGATSGAIINLQNQIDDMKDGSVSGSLQNQIDEMNDGSVSGSLQQQINRRVREIGFRHFLFIGDSYDQIIPGKSWAAIASNTAHVGSYIKRTSGGFGFVSNGVYTWYNLLVSNPFTDAEKEAITDVVIGGGTNDSQASHADITAAMSQMDTYLKGLFPNLKRIYISYMGWSHLNATQKGQHRTTYQTYLSNSLILGWRWMQGVEYILHNPLLINRDVADRVHPNSDGVDQLGYAVGQAIMNGSTLYRASITDVGTPDTTNITGSNVGIPSVITNNSTEIEIPDMTFTAARNLSSYFDILSRSDGNEFNFIQYRYFNVIINHNGNLINASLFSTDTKKISLWLRAGATIPSGDSFTIHATSISIPTI